MASARKARPEGALISLVAVQLLLGRRGTPGQPWDRGPKIGRLCSGMPVRGEERAPALPPAALPWQPTREYDSPARWRRNRGRGPPGLPECREQEHRGAPRRIHKRCGARAGLGGRRHGYGLACATAVTFGPKSGPKRPPVLEQDISELPPGELTVTRRGVRQQHEMTARCGPRPGRYYKQEPLARGLSDGERARGQFLRYLRRRNRAAEHQAYRAAGGALAHAGAAPKRFYRGPGRSLTERGQPVAGLPLCVAGVRLRPRSKPEGVESFGGLGRKWRIAANPEGLELSGPT